MVTEVGVIIYAVEIDQLAEDFVQVLKMAHQASPT